MTGWTEDEWEETEKREEALRGEIAVPKHSHNRELKDFTGQILTGFVSVRSGRPSLSVIFLVHCYLWRVQAGQSAVSARPQSGLLPDQSVLISPGASLSPLLNGSVRHPPYVPPFKKGEQNEVKIRERPFVIVKVERRVVWHSHLCPPRALTPLWQANLEGSNVWTQ